MKKEISPCISRRNVYIMYEERSIYYIQGGEVVCAKKRLHTEVMCTKKMCTYRQYPCISSEPSCFRYVHEETSTYRSSVHDETSTYRSSVHDETSTYRSSVHDETSTYRQYPCITVSM